MICLLLPFAEGYPQNAFRRHSVKKGSAVGRSEVPLATRLRSREPLFLAVLHSACHYTWSVIAGTLEKKPTENVNAGHVGLP